MLLFWTFSNVNLHLEQRMYIPSNFEDFDFHFCTPLGAVWTVYSKFLIFILEPKFEIPSGDPYTGGWCRPQTDGPALRAMALSKWGMILNNAGQSSSAKSDVWPLVSFDMEWVLANWESEGCDLWEEVRSDNFYFNR